MARANAFKKKRPPIKATSLLPMDFGGGIGRLLASFRARGRRRCLLLALHIPTLEAQTLFETEHFNKIFAIDGIYSTIGILNI